MLAHGVPQQRTLSVEGSLDLLDLSAIVTDPSSSFPYRPTRPRPQAQRQQSSHVREATMGRLNAGTVSWQGTWLEKGDS